MRRVGFPSQDAAEPFEFEDVAEPVPGPGQVLVRTEAVGVGLGLVRMLRAGAVPASGPGGEMVGHIAAIGTGVGIPRRRPGGRGGVRVLLHTT